MCVSVDALVSLCSTSGHAEKVGKPNPSRTITVVCPCVLQHEPRRPKSRPMRVVTPAINQDVLRYIGGENIYKLCENVPAYWVLEMHNYNPRTCRLSDYV